MNQYPRLTKKQVKALIKSCPAGDWTFTSKRNGHGDYGFDETYYLDRMPIFKLSIEYNPPSCTAYDMRVKEQSHV